ncbi:hypothetical protein AB0478_40110 [Streptomyces sp. NPDC051917]|uniref:hypothetical protein n=1 Tax=Streptomyces sp. NPDC051917 TaxID=3154754 RepID=UPI003454974C
MNRPAIGTTPARSPRPGTAPGAPLRPLALPAGASRRKTRSKLPRMGQLAVDTTDRGRIIDLRRDADTCARLAHGRAGGRYRCLACGHRLILQWPSSPASRFTPRFRHDTAASGASGADHCPAPAQHQANIQADLTTMLALRDQLLHVLPQAGLSLRIDPELAGQRWEIPPALIVRRGEHVVVLERPRRLLTPAAVARRLTATRTQHGPKAAHWWVFDRDDPLHCDVAGTVNVQPYDRTIAHTKVRPTPAQRQIAAAGATVCWLADDTVLLPYGGHQRTYTSQSGEDWSGDMASWQRDWTISHPLPADGASWWGLIPQPLLALGKQPSFRPAAALATMSALERAEHGRERHRRRRAREHAKQRTQTTPAQLPLPAPATAASEPADTPKTPTLVPPSPASAPEPQSPPTVPDPPKQAPSPRRRRRFNWRSLLPHQWGR